MFPIDVLRFSEFRTMRNHLSETLMLNDCEELDGSYERGNEQLEKNTIRSGTSLTKFASQVSLYLETGLKRTISAYHH